MFVDKNNSFFLAAALTVVILILLWILGTEASLPKRFVYIFVTISMSAILHEHLIKNSINSKIGGDFAFGDPDGDLVSSGLKFDAISEPTH